MYPRGNLFLMNLEYSLIFLFLSCSKEVIPEILNPQTSSLLSPANNETCLDGISINDSQSDVNFSWTTTQNTVSYDVIVTNLTTQSQQTFSSSLKLFRNFCKISATFPDFVKFAESSQNV